MHFNATQALQRAREDGIDWLFYIDDDELIYTPTNRADGVLEGISPATAVVILPTCEGVPDRPSSDLVFRDVSIFRNAATIMSPLPHWINYRLAKYFQLGQVMVARAAGCGNAMFEGEYFRGQTWHCKERVKTG